ncbi:MAG: phenylalanine--tRNA ligase subunit alpha [Clostridia bacterium]|nr:phenylalanine--tRNA ligase subunit alpha [Clostridia bacterium]
MSNNVFDLLNRLEQDFEVEAAQVASKEKLDEIRVKYLGKKSEINSVLKGLKDMEPEARKIMGAKASAFRENVERFIKSKETEIVNLDIARQIEAAGGFDITLPGDYALKGSLHPITIVAKELVDIFTSMGFNVVDGPELESEYYNFEALNVPADHPARDMQDTYWCDNGQLLRTQTSTCQIRAMEKFGAPLKIVAPGRCFRNESIDASHENTFFQFEGMVIDKDVSISNLIYCMKQLLSKFFQKDVEVRLRPGFFPFVEPGFELDLKCMICGGKGCPTCKHSGWIELLPCGMVHPNVLRAGGIDPEEYTGFAFGGGLTRLAMMRYGIRDIRVLNSGDIRVMEQFNKVIY